jgi:hypothetical protein
LSTESFDVAFRHLSIPTDAGDICGICLSYQSEEGARSFFGFIHEYLSAPGQIPRRLVEVRAERESDESYALTIEVGLGSRLRRIQIAGVDWEHIDSIRQSLNTFAYYLVIAGYDLPTGEFEPLPLSDNHLFLSRITIDNQRYTGNPKGKFPWSRLVHTKDIVYQFNE